MRPSQLAAAWLLTLSLPAHAHLLKVFSYVEGGNLHGNVYFSGGEPARAASIKIRNASGDLLESLVANEKGEFVTEVTATTALLVIADSGDGHRAEWTVSRDEINPVTYASKNTSTKTTAAGDPQLLALVEQAVARQIGPLRRELQASQQRARLSDIVGGIGLIFGIAGVVLWWRSRSAAANNTIHRHD